MKRIKTNPDHKATFTVGVRCSCSCGWQSAMWLGKGAKRNAAAEWREHREKCEAKARVAVHDIPHNAEQRAAAGWPS